ncbi:MAG: PKD domain-containing protein, partial [Prolixibacteraceae bacterium]|nr:PKD domain-containing protein [Prolixibacteraceae bacterium]
MRAATLKALVIETADEAGSNDGPDYEFGWGLMNTEKAALKISENQNLNVIDELVLNNGASFTRTVHSNGLEPVKVTICWTELPGNPVSASLDPINPMLINDLDLRITLADDTYYSWKLDRDNPGNAATNNSENNVDNVELVYIAAPIAGDYTITVDHDGTLSGGSQAFSIVYDGITETNPVPPVADFVANNTTIFEGEPISFTDLSTGNPTSWSWTFSGGTPASASIQNPVVIYNTAGTYEVSLTATNSLGSDIETKAAYITVNIHPPVANFSSDITSVLIGESVNFADLSTYNPESWSWSFPGGTPATSTVQNPIVTYNTLGTYEVSLSVTNAGGSDTKTITDYITVTDGSISYCESYGNATDEWIRFVGLGVENNSSTNSGAAGYEDFTGIPTFNLESGTVYNLTLSPGFSGRSTFEYWSVWIDFNIDGDFDDQGEQIFTASKKKSTVEGIVTIPSALSGETRMRVSMSGSGITAPCDIFTRGEVEDYTVQIGEAVPQPPIAEFTANTTSVTEGQSILFTDLSVNDPTSWSWTFAGGIPATSTSQNPLITYNTEGTYSVTLTATNGLGSDTNTKTNYITVSAAGNITYCTSQSNSNALEWISQVNIGTFGNASGASFYSDFTSSIINLSPGSSNTVTLTPYFTGRDQREFWRVWIDFNIDGDFEDADETVFIVNNKKFAVSGIINVPTYASGQTRMRITMKNGSAPVPCESFGGGEVEDYTVNFEAVANKSTFLNSNIPDNAISEVSFYAYPNPAYDKLFLQFNGWLGNKVIRLIDLTGKTVLLQKMSGTNVEIVVSSIPKGIYFIDANNGIHREIKKISIQ